MVNAYKNVDKFKLHQNYYHTGQYYLYKNGALDSGLRNEYSLERSNSLFRFLM